MRKLLKTLNITISFHLILRAVSCPASHGAFQCLEQLHLTHHTDGEDSWSSCTSHLWKTLCCWIPNMAREHSYFKTESPSLWHKNAESVFQTLCSSWELLFLCTDGALLHTHSAVPYTEITHFFAKQPELSFTSQHGEHGHAELSVCTYLFFGSLIFAM